MKAPENKGNLCIIFVSNDTEIRGAETTLSPICKVNFAYFHSFKFGLVAT